MQYSFVYQGKMSVPFELLFKISLDLELAFDSLLHQQLLDIVVVVHLVHSPLIQ